MLCHLFARSSYVQLATVVKGTAGEGADLAFEQSVGMGTARNCSGVHDMWGRIKDEGAALASIRSVGVSSASHCGCRHDR